MKRMYSLFDTLDTNQPLIFFGLYGDGHDDADAPFGEMRIEWEQLPGKLTPRLKVFNDGWQALATFTDLLQELAQLDGTNPPPATVIEALVRCGFVEYPS